MKYINNLHFQKIRLDISNQLIAEVIKIDSLENKQIVYGRKRIGNHYVCSGGFIGNEGDIVVNDFKNPKYIVGICDGMGGFKKRLNIDFNLKALS